MTDTPPGPLHGPSAPGKSCPAFQLRKSGRAVALLGVSLLLAGCQNPVQKTVESVFGLPVPPVSAPSSLPDIMAPPEAYRYPSFRNADGTYTHIRWVPAGIGNVIQKSLTGQPTWDAVSPIVGTEKVFNDSTAATIKDVPGWKNDTGLSTITMRGSLDQIDECNELIQYLLASIPLIQIEARVVEVSETDQFGFGLDWFVLEQEDHAGNAGAGTGQLPPTSTLFGRGSAGSGIPGLPGTVRSEIIPNLLLELGTIRDGLRVDLLVSALRQFTKVDVVNAPNVVVRSGHVAQITSGEEVPYFTVNVSGNNNNITTKFKPVGVRLNVLPALLTPELIELKVDLRVENVTGISTIISGGAATANPIVSTRSATTTLSVKNGSTVVLGGLITTGSFEVEDQIPVLGDIPLLSPLFTNRNKESNRSNLIFFIRPVLMPNPLSRQSGIIEPPSEGEMIAPPPADEEEGR